MTLQTLYDQIGSQLRICSRRGEDTVCIEIPGSGFGGTSVVNVQSASCGIDWDDGKFIIRPEVGLDIRHVTLDDKTAIEKAREALVEIANQEVGTWDKPVPFSVLYRRSVDIACEASAALDADKTAVDTVSIRVDTDSIREAVIKIGMNFMRSFMFAAEIDLIKFAEAYHAKKRAVERLRTLEEVKEALLLGNLESIAIVIDRLIGDAKKAVEE